MSIGLIDVTNLTRVRETFKPTWRAVVTVIFLLSVLFWWAAVNRLESLAPLVDDETLRTRTLILAAVVLIPLTAALFRRNDGARLFFVLAIILSTVTVTLVLLVLVVYVALSVSSWDSMAVTLAVIGALFFMMVYDQYLVIPCYVLSRSLMPFGRWKAYRQQVVYSLRLWSGRWKGVEEQQEVRTGETPYLTSGARYRLALGWLSYAVGMVVLVLALYSFLNRELLPAVGRLEFSTAWHMLRHFHISLPVESSATAGSLVLQFTNSTLALLLGFFFFFIFGYFRTQWRRENVPIYRVPLLRHMTPSDLLLLRSFSDDVKYVARNSSPLTMLFRVYGWSYTFEQLIVERLRYLGRVRLIDVEQEREGLLDKWGLRHVGRVLGRDRLRRLLISVFPAVWYKLPAQGGVRYYVEAKRGQEEWREEVEKAMCLARLVVVLLGTTSSLMWEMGRIEQLRLSGKTVFVMPPLIRKKNYRVRWQQFIDFVCAARGCDRRLLGRVNPKRVLAAIVSHDTLVIMTARRNSKTFYESALDVAALLAVADPAQSAKMIPRYLE